MTLASELITAILSFLPLSILAPIQWLPLSLHQLLQKKRDWLKTWPDEPLLERVLPNLLDLPILEWQDRFMSTDGIDYVDHVSLKDMTAPIMIGRDSMHRPFVAYVSPEQDNVNVLFMKRPSDHGWYCGGQRIGSLQIKSCLLWRGRILAPRSYHDLSQLFEQWRGFFFDQSSS